VKEAMEMRLKAVSRWEIGEPENESRMELSIQGFDVVIQTEEQRARHSKFGPTIISLPTPPLISALRKNSVSHYLSGRSLSRDAMSKLSFGRTKLLAKLQSEIHGRASFAISCLVLVMIGCSLGMLFRTSNFLSAFAVSFIPAMFSVALIVTGQQVCSHARNSAALGLTFIWGGNALVLLLAMGLIAKLQRT
jgi:lipopolysaccharide export LptBFGC system permease protein LptF